MHFTEAAARLAYATLSVILLSGSAMSATVKYCVEDGAAGFSYDKQRKVYEDAYLKQSRFAMSVDGTLITLKEGSMNPVFNCSEDNGGRRVLNCIDDTGYAFIYNQTSGRFVLSRGFGFVYGDGDSVSLSYGTCAEF